MIAKIASALICIALVVGTNYVMLANWAHATTLRKVVAFCLDVGFLSMLGLWIHWNFFNKPSKFP